MAGACARGEKVVSLPAAVLSGREGTRPIVPVTRAGPPNALEERGWRFFSSSVSPAVVDSLAAADERGVAVHVATDAAAVRERVENAGIDARVFTTGLVEWFTAMADSPRIGRLVMADRGSVLVSALHEEELPGVSNETAAWSDGIDHGFATFVERVLTFEMKEHGEGGGGTELA